MRYEADSHRAIAGGPSLAPPTSDLINGPCQGTPSVHPASPDAGREARRAVPKTAGESGVLTPEVGEVRAGLQDNRRDFDSTKYGPGDRSAVLSGDPKTDGRAEAKDRAGPSAGQRGGLAQYFQYSSHSVTPAQRATNWDSESIQIVAPARSERAQNVEFYWFEFAGRRVTLRR